MRGGEVSRPIVRCAIYTRKSADERPDSQLGSTTRQRELCEAYIASQAGEGWVTLPTIYEDIGFSGGTLKRPAMRQLLDDVATGAIDVVVIYKIDRLTRSLRDFLELVDQLDCTGTSIVSITQAFDTRSSMGRLTLNVLLSFAQFERELTSDRLKDWFAGAHDRGIWPRRAPFGYTKDASQRLIVDPVQAEVVRYIFRRYPVLGSARMLAKEMAAMGYRNRNGNPWKAHGLVMILHNRLYCGFLPHRDREATGHHEAIVSVAQWRRADATMIAGSQRRGAIREAKPASLVSDLLHSTMTSRRLIRVIARSRGRDYAYYIASVARYQASDLRLRAADVDTAVRRLFENLTGFPLPQDVALASGELRRTVARIDVGADDLQMQLIAGGTGRIQHAGLIRPVFSTRKHEDGKGVLLG